METKMRPWLSENSAESVEVNVPSSFLKDIFAPNIPPTDAFARAQAIPPEVTDIDEATKPFAIAFSSAW